MSVNMKTIHTTAPGISVYPKLVKPDTKYKKEGEYTTKMKFPKEVEDALVAELNTLADEAYAEHCKENKKKLGTLKRANFPWQPEIEKVYGPDPDDPKGDPIVVEENPTGFLLFNFKLKAEIKTRKGEVIHPKPLLYDAAGKGVKPEGLEIGGGSELKIAFTVRPFYTEALGSGLTLQIKGAQILKLVEFGARSAESLGFGAVAGGFDGSEGEAPGMPSAGDAGPDPADTDF